MHPAGARVVTNLCDAQVTVDVGGSSCHDRIILNNDSFRTDDLDGIVVSGMPCRAAAGYSPEDCQYVELETLAVWMALLRTARCKVLNRPAPEVPPAAFRPLHVRAIARAAGIPTIDDQIGSGADLVRLRDNGEDVACVDLYDQSAFWLTRLRRWTSTGCTQPRVSPGPRNRSCSPACVIAATVKWYQSRTAPGRETLRHRSGTKQHRAFGIWRNFSDSTTPSTRFR